jgi:hypothetical protein
MINTLFQWQEVEVTPEEEEAWQNFLTKYHENPPRQENLETTIPREKKDGIQ